jgi:hypothetical protein
MASKMAIIALMMEAVQTSETLVNLFQSTRRYNPEDSHHHCHRREDLKSSVALFTMPIHFKKFQIVSFISLRYKLSSSSS